MSNYDQAMEYLDGVRDMNSSDVVRRAHVLALLAVADELRADRLAREKGCEHVQVAISADDLKGLKAASDFVKFAEGKDQADLGEVARLASLGVQIDTDGDVPLHSGALAVDTHGSVVRVVRTDGTRRRVGVDYLDGTGQAELDYRDLTPTDSALRVGDKVRDPSGCIGEVTVLNDGGTGRTCVNYYDGQGGRSWWASSVLTLVRRTLIP